MINYINFKIGRHLENKKQWQKAFAIYQKIAKSSKKTDPALAYRLGFTAQKIGNFKVAIDWLLLAVKATPYKPHWCLRLGKVAIASDNAEAALTAYAHGGMVVFTDAAWHFALGQLLEKAKDYPQAAHFYGQAWHLAPGEANYAYRLGRAHQQNKDYSSAIAAYRQALALAPNHADTLICLARSLQEAQQPEQAEPVFRRLLALEHAGADKHRHSAHYQLGCILAGQGQHSAALQSFGIALQLQPRHGSTWLAQAHSQQALGQYPSALDSLAQACAAQPKNSVWHKEYYQLCEEGGQYAVQKGNVQEALTAYAHGGMVVFTDAAWHFALGQLLEKAKDYPQAAHFYGQAWHLAPGEANYAYRLGRAHQQNQDYDSAIAAYRQALALAPNHADTLICLARSLQEAQQPEQAAPVFRQLLALDGADADKHRQTAHYQLGCILAGQGQHSAALQSLGAALQLQPQHAPSWLAQARSQQALGQYPQALNSLVQACAVQPKHTAALLALAQLRMCNGPFAGAAQVWVQLLAQQPANTYWLQQHAVALDMAGQQQAAIAAYQKLHVRLIMEESDKKTSNAQCYQQQVATNNEVIGSTAVDCYIEAYNHLREKNYSFAQKHFSQALEQAGSLAPAHWYYRLAQALQLGGLASAAEVPIQQAMVLQPGNTYYASQFALIIRKQNRTWQEVEALQHTLAIAQSPANPNPNSSSIVQWQWELGEAQDKMNRFAEAASAYQQANQVQPGDALRHFTEGYAWERAGDAHQAAQAYAAAIAADQTLGAAQWGIGVFHQERGFWAQAALAYASQLQRQPDNAQLHYRLGLAHERCYAWQAAVDSYCQALALDIHQPECHYHLGFVYERLGMWSEAAQAYQSAVARGNDHCPQWYYRLGHALVQLEKPERAAQILLETDIFGSAHGVDADCYKKDKNLLQVLEYTEYFEHLPIQPQMVMYESFSGSNVSCNPLAICLAIIDDPAFAGWVHIWSLTQFGKLPSQLKNRKNIILVERDSQLYRRYLATAGWLINNSTFPSYFIRRAEQRYLNTWHGTPLKTLGRDMRGRLLEHKNGARNFLQATHLLSPNAHTSAIMLESFEISQLYGGEFMEGGYPRADITVNSGTEEKQGLCTTLQLDANRPLVLYAPTWRGVLGGVDFDTQRLKTDLAELKNAGHQILFRGHSLAESIIREQAPEITLVPEDIDTNTLLAVVDVLITDYSSIFFEFISLGRPILYYAYDQDEYLLERGMYFDLAEMPGEVCNTLEELLAHLQNPQEWLTQPAMQAKYQAAKEKFCLHDDGCATQRVIEWFFNNQPQLGYASSVPLRNPADTVVVFCGPFMGNGITSAAISLCRLAHQNNLPITLVVESNDINRFADRIQRLAQLGNTVQILGRVGRLAYTSEEKALFDRNIEGGISAEAFSVSMSKLYEREFIRCFGRASMRAIVNFEGYSKFWAELFAYGRSDIRKIIYQHNDMYGEFTVKFPYLRTIFNTYHYYDAVVSVSPAMCEENAKNLSLKFSIPVNKFTSAINPIDTDSIFIKSREPLDKDISQWLSKGEGPLFLNIGRFSPEKCPEKLIAAFTLYRNQGGKGRLLMVGDGPLRQTVAEQVSTNPYAQNIFLAGYRMNPYPLFMIADCFVLPSDHEGQPITLLESLELQLPTIATDIPSNRYVLGGGVGHLVENSIQGLAQALHDFSQGQCFPSATFDSKKYLHQAWEEFSSLIAVP